MTAIKTPARPRAKNLADPRGTRALVDRIRAMNPGSNPDFRETYSDAMGVVEDYVRLRLRRGR